MEMGGHRKMADSKTKEKKAAKAKVDKYNGFKVPPRIGRASGSVCWCNHVYHMIEEAKPELLQREDVRNAYNAVIDCCRKYDGTLDSWCPSKNYKYREGIKLLPPAESKYNYFRGLPCRFTYEYDAWNNTELKTRLSTETADIVASYSTLYDLIKRDVVPYMETKQHEINSKKQIEHYHNQMERYEKDIKDWEAAIESTRKTIAECAQKCMKLQAGPVLTKFD
jgi:archaellum component FlaC